MRFLIGKIIFVIVGLCMYGCMNQLHTNNEAIKVLYYANSDNVYQEIFQLDSIRLLCNKYYPNNVLGQKSYGVKVDSVTSIDHGQYWEYYEDGFSKQSYMVDSGLLLCPKITGEIGNHKILVDIQKKKCRYEEEGKLDPFDFHRFRIYVEGIPLAHYWVSILTKEGNSPRDPLKCDYKLTATCTISPEPNSQKDTSIVEIDETLYQYILTEYDNKWCLRDSNGVQGYLFGIHYADTTGWIGEKPRETIFVPFQSDF